MELAMIGLGRMGGNMAERLLKAGHRVVGFDLEEGAVRRLVERGAEAAASLAGAASRLEPPRTVWLMVPPGAAVDRAIGELEKALAPGDIVVDGGNSHYRDSLRRAAALERKGIDFVDVGTSGGVWGLAEGYSLMVGGRAEAVRRIEPILRDLAPSPDRGWGHVGPAGAGHFVKMAHNAIEYGLMQAYAEGFALLARKRDFSLDLAQIAEIWRSGSVVRSWLLDLIARALAENPRLEGVKPYVEDSGEGRWALAEAVELDLATPVIALSLLQRLRSRDERSFADRLLAVLRQQFGGHAVRREGS
jgi:6-phosphogluconate dehydrogenase